MGTARITWQTACDRAGHSFNQWDTGLDETATGALIDQAVSNRLTWMVMPADEQFAPGGFSGGGSSIIDTVGR
jgi:hypothetical protein